MTVGSSIPPTTLEAQKVKMSDERRKALKALAKERDDQRIDPDTSSDKWRDLMDRARRLFRDCQLPKRTTDLLLQLFAVRRLPGIETETGLALVLGKAQNQSVDAATQELRRLGVQPPFPVDGNNGGGRRGGPPQAQRGGH